MSQKRSGLVQVSPEELMPLFSEILSRAVIKGIIAKIPGVTLYWRIFTPLITLWCFVLQRLNHDHSCDEIVTHLHTGSIDNIDPEDPHTTPLSQRLQSESNSAYVQGRNRLPLVLLQRSSELICKRIEEWQGENGHWKGFAVRLLDGTTFRMPPEGDLIEAYGQSSNQHGRNHWVKARSVAAFDLISQAAIAIVEAAYTVGETALVYAVMKQDEAHQALYIGDSGFGIYRVLQAVVATNKDCLFRLSSTRAKKLLKDNGISIGQRSGCDHQVIWRHSRHDKIFPDLPSMGVVGRLIYIRVKKKGFRPIDVYLFTTLCEDELYLTVDICDLYMLRWQVEINFRYIKTAMDMEFFAVKSAAIFRKELAAGVLAYNLICAFMVKAALLADILPSRLSFKRCWRRIRNLLIKGVPSWSYAQGQVLTHFLFRLVQCKIVHATCKVLHEPRKTRRKPSIYPALKGSREDARQEVLCNMVTM